MADAVCRRQKYKPGFRLLPWLTEETEHTMLSLQLDRCIDWTIRLVRVRCGVIDIQLYNVCSEDYWSLRKD